ncbi:MAG: ATP-dependent DNA helicase RecG [Acidimicrobiia bacterium]|nr:MAG: ATP-dependent DNA helicase RecG [Acidimicrobiia bacterium]
MLHEVRTLAYLAGIATDQVKGIGTKSMEKLESHGIRSVADLLLTVPRRYLDRSQLFNLGAAPIGEVVTVGGTVTSFSKRRISRGRTMVEAKVSDGTSSVRCVWFNPYIKLTEGEEVALSGKVETYRGSLQMKSPDVDRLSGNKAFTTGIVLPVYPGLGGLRPYMVRDAVANALRRSVPVADIVPEEILDRFDLVDRTFAFTQVHSPDSFANTEPARRRLIFDEFLRIQMALKVRAHDEYESQIGVRNSVKGELFHRFVESLPYRLTDAQDRVLSELLADMKARTPMHRLLQGEVGSGKTVVVVAALLTSVESGHQGAVMAPTEVLATQHYLGTELAFEDAGMAPTREDVGAAGTGSLFAEETLATRPVRIGLFTGSRVTTNFVVGDVSRKQGLEWLAEGTIDLAFGTQALIQGDVAFHSLGMVVVDEQHRFGVEQRVVMRDKNQGEGVPDLLLLTATPIPRTLAMTLYGDLKVSVIDEMPEGRTPVSTAAVPEAADDEIDRRIQEAVTAGGQVFVVCPLVEDSDKIEARSAESEIVRVQSGLPGLRSALLHGQMSAYDKAEIMHRFRAGEVDVLVATTVIEVGIDVPNATLMVIRTADRFGLSQLHQLRGRVGRGERGGACLLAADPTTPDGERRIEAMIRSTDGFELSEIDLEIRGQGTVFGGAQSGAADLRLGDILRDHALLDAASSVATESVAEDPDGELVTDVMHEVAALFGESAQWLTRS